MTDLAREILETIQEMHKVLAAAESKMIRILGLFHGRENQIFTIRCIYDAYHRGDIDDKQLIVEVERIANLDTTGAAL